MTTVRHFTYVPKVRSWLSLVVAATVAWSSITDNAAVCPDGVGGTTSGPCSDEGAPATPCISCPCRLPVLAASRSVIPAVLWQIGERAVFWPELSLHAADPVEPPTPPPLA